MPVIAERAAWVSVVVALPLLCACQDGARAALGGREAPAEASTRMVAAFARPAHPLTVSVPLHSPGPEGLVVYRFADATVDEIQGTLLASGCVPEAADEFARRFAHGELRAWMGITAKAGEVVAVSQPALAFRAENGVQGMTLKKPDGSLLVSWSVTIDGEREAALVRGYDYLGDVVVLIGDGQRTVRLPIAVHIRKIFVPGHVETSGEATVGECVVRADQRGT
jgi:hypothetical protein